MWESCMITDTQRVLGYYKGDVVPLHVDGDEGVWDTCLGDKIRIEDTYRICW